MSATAVRSKSDSQVMYEFFDGKTLCVRWLDSCLVNGDRQHGGGLLCYLRQRSYSTSAPLVLGWVTISGQINHLANGI